MKKNVLPPSEVVLEKPSFVVVAKCPTTLFGNFLPLSIVKDIHPHWRTPCRRTLWILVLVFVVTKMLNHRLFLYPIPFRASCSPNQETPRNLMAMHPWVRTPHHLLAIRCLVLGLVLVPPPARKVDTLKHRLSLHPLPFRAASFANNKSSCFSIKSMGLFEGALAPSSVRSRIHPCQRTSTLCSVRRRMASDPLL